MRQCATFSRNRVHFLHMNINLKGSDNIMKNINSKCRSNISSAFTLIEILSVVLIIVLLMTIVAGLFKLATSKMKYAEQMSVMKQVETAMEINKTRTGHYVNEELYQSKRSDSGDLHQFYIFHLPAPGVAEKTLVDYFPDYEGLRDKYTVWHDDSYVDADNNGTPDLNTTTGGYDHIGDGAKFKWSAILVDVWGNKMWYRYPGSHNKTKYDLESAGPDGVFGYTSDLNDDYDCSLSVQENQTHKNPAHPEFAADNINNWSN